MESNRDDSQDVDADSGMMPTDTHDATISDHARLVAISRAREMVMLADNPWFDAQWYVAHYPDVTQAQVDPLEHFVYYGSTELRDPGPHFNTAWYLENNPDVDGDVLNALVHYLDHGRAEGRLPNEDGSEPVIIEAATLDASPQGNPESREAQDIALLHGHRLFEAAWYLARYPEVASQDIDPARHYLLYGGFEGKNPGPDFHSEWYTENNSDVAAIRLNPLVHYIRYGEAEGRLFAPENPATANLLSPDEAAAAATVQSDLALAEIDQLEPTKAHFLVRMHGHSLGLIPIDWSDGTPAPLQPILTTAVMHEWDERVAITLRSAAASRNSRETPPLDLWALQTLAIFDVAGARIVDLWFASDFDLRMRIEPLHGPQFGTFMRMRFYQSDGSELTLCGESILTGESPAFIDVKLHNPFKPLLIVLTTMNGIIADTSLLPFPSLVRGGPHHAEVVVMGERASRMEDLARLSDSILRETLNWGDSGDALAIARIDIDLRDALGNERIFDPLVRDWLAEIFRLTLSAINSDALSDSRARSRLTQILAERSHLPPAILQSIKERRLASHSALILPHDALPTLSALASRRMEPAGSEPIPGPFLMADATTARATWSVAIPAIEGMDAVQPQGALPYPRVSQKSPKKGVSGSSSTVPIPLAIRYAVPVSNPSALVLPHALDATTPVFTSPLSSEVRETLGVSVVIAATNDQVALAGLLSSLSTQDHSDLFEIIVITGPNAIAATADIKRRLQALFPGRHTLTNSPSHRPATQINMAAALATKSHILFVDQAMVLHDRRTIDSLLRLAIVSNVATVGCSHVQEASSGGALTITAGAYFPVGVAIRTAPGVIFEEPKAKEVALHATLPVAANVLRFVMVNRDIWVMLGGLADSRFPTSGSDIEFGIRAKTAGYIHLNTTAIMVTDTAHRPNGAFMDVLAANYLPPQAWQDVIATTALIRELR